MDSRKSLSEILRNESAGSWVDDSWDSVAPAADLLPLPSGKYVAHLTAKDFGESSKGTPCVKLVFVVVQGEHTGRKLFADIWLTDRAAPQARRDLAKLGITCKAQLEAPLPADKRIRCELTVFVRTADTGNVFNAVRSFQAIGVDDVPPDPFAPPADLPAPPPDAAPAPLDPAAPRPSLFGQGKSEANGSHLRERR